MLLAHALVARLADDAGARVLFIKGPTAVTAGARPDRPSTDVDALVDPGSFEALCSAVESAGWVRRWGRSPLRHAGDLAFDHSVHYVHDGWPIDLDLHFTFPGFLATEQSVFDALWHRSTRTPVAQVQVPTADRLGHVLVTGLHALRDPDEPRSRADLEFLRAVVSSMDRADAQGLLDLAVATGSDRTAEPLLAATGLASPVTSAGSPAGDHGARLWEWRTRQQQHPGALIWLRELRRSSWREVPGVVRRALYPDRDQLVSSLTLHETDGRTVARLRLERLGRGVAGVLRHLRGRTWRLLRRRRDQVRQGGP